MSTASSIDVYRMLNIKQIPVSNSKSATANISTNEWQFPSNNQNKWVSFYVLTDPVCQSQKGCKNSLNVQFDIKKFKCIWSYSYILYYNWDMLLSGQNDCRFVVLLGLGLETQLGYVVHSF